MCKFGKTAKVPKFMKQIKWIKQERIEQFFLALMLAVL